MSYCVNCGVELDPSAGICPLCHTPVVNPGRPVDEEAPPRFPLVKDMNPLYQSTFPINR